MAYFAIAFIAPNYRDYKNQWLKAYEPGTTTPKAMALDSAAAVTVVKLQLNADGFLKSAGDALVIPYIDGAYDLWLFPTSAEADANDTSSAIRVADDINSTNLSLINDLSQAYTFKTVALMQASTIVFPVGKKVFWQGYYTESDGGSNWGIVTAGAHTDDGGSVFTLADGKYIAANLIGKKISVHKFGAVGDADPLLYTGTDDTTRIQAALDYSEGLLLLEANTQSDINFGSKGGTTIAMDSRAYLVSQIEIPSWTSFVGKGKNSSLIVSNSNLQIIRNKLTSGIGYDKLGTRLADFSVRGDRTKLSQVGIDTLRLFDCLIENITISVCGGRGLVLRQALLTKAKGVTVSNCVGPGITITEGITSWDNTALENLPANANTLDNCHCFANDGAGLHITGLANGNIIRGGSYENNYLAAGTNTGYNIEVDALTIASNTIDGIWTEGPVRSHIYVNAASISSSLEVNNWKNISNGPTGHVDRALIVAKGTVKVKDSFGQAQSYALINGSTRPFRRGVSGGEAALRVTDAVGSLITDGIFIEDENGLDDSGSQQKNLNRAISGVKFDSTFASTDVNTLKQTGYDSLLFSMGNSSTRIKL